MFFFFKQKTAYDMRISDWSSDVCSFRSLPGKAALDREAGALGIEVAENRMEDARHQAALLLSGYWNDWLVAGGLYRNDLVTVRWLEKELSALRRRVAL